jgi:alkanesulfonate monooxygenase SsuD/methylene tetrahydromethanopterin reductase-like flavin-dependent oxidoreductase (luciferase family)
MDYVYCYLSYFGYEAGQATMSGFWDEMKKLGKDSNPYRAGFLQFVGVAENEDEAMRLYREPADYFYNRCLHVSPRWTDPPGYSSEATKRKRVVSQVQLAAQNAAQSMLQQKPSFEEMVDKGYVIVGGPDQVAEKLREVAINLNCGHLMLLLQFGNMRRDLVTYNTDLFLRRVKPQLQDLFDDKWEDRWWPKPLTDIQVARPRAVAS